MNYTTAKASIILLAAIAMLGSGCVTLEETISRANGGDGAAQYSLYEAYSSGDFKGQKVEKNRQLALDYLAKAAKSDSGNKKYRQELLNCYMRDERLDKMDEIMSDYHKTFEPRWSWSEAANIIDTSDFREIAPKYTKAILQQPYPTLAEAKKVFAQADKFNEFAQQTLLVADIYNYGVFDQNDAKKGDTNYQIERRNAYERASKLGLRNGDYKLTVSSFNCLADIHNAIVDAKNKYGEILEEAKRKEEERRVAEEQRREEEARIAHEKAEKEAEERKMQEKEEARIAHEKAEKDWQEKKDDVDYKFPLHKDYPSQTALYKEIKTGVSLEWLAMFLSHGDFTNVQIRASSQKSYLNPTNIVFFDANRKVYLDFGEISAKEGPILIRGEIEFPKGDVSDEALIARYQKDYPNAAFSNKEETIKMGGGLFFGQMVPLVTLNKCESTFITDQFSLTVYSIKSAKLDLGDHHIDEYGNYTGAAVDALNEVVVFGTGAGARGAEIDARARQAMDKWNEVNEKCRIPSVIIEDIPLREASIAASIERKRLEDEKAKRTAEEADKKRRAAEEARANDF